MTVKECEIVGGTHSRTQRAVARVSLSWYSRATNEQETEEVDVCSVHLDSKRREFGPNPEPNMFGPPLNPKFKIVERYGS